VDKTLKKLYGNGDEEAIFADGTIQYIKGFIYFFFLVCYEVFHLLLLIIGEIKFDIL
jgi:hypothetical protein